MEVRPCPVRIPHACLRRPMEIFKSFWLIGTYKRWLGGIAPYPVRVLFRERALSHYLQFILSWVLDFRRGSNLDFGRFHQDEIC